MQLEQIDLLVEHQLSTSKIPTVDVEMNKLSESTERDRCDPPTNDK